MSKYSHPSHTKYHHERLGKRARPDVVLIDSEVTAYQDACLTEFADMALNSTGGGEIEPRRLVMCYEKLLRSFVTADIKKNKPN